MRLSAINRLLVLIGSLIPSMLAIFPAYALKISLGVVKSRENSGQWVQIINRIKATGVDYCTLDAADWQNISDLQDVRVLMLPNVSNLNGAQVETLNTWTKGGGKLIVTGPTGTLAQPEVQSQLQEIVGASWGFINSAPATLQIKNSQKTLWGQEVDIYSNLVGGVLIPVDDTTTETVAVWLSDGSPSAVTRSSQAVYLGWRWGEDQVVSSTMDTAWLQAALNRYGIKGYNSLLPESDSRSCTQTHLGLDEQPPIIPDIEKTQ